MTNQSTLLCPTCGAQLPAGANFCETCGHSVNRPQPAQPAPSNPQPYRAAPAAAYAPPYTYGPPPASKSNKTLPVILGVLGCLGVICIALVVIGIVLFTRSSPVIKDITQMASAVPTRAAQTAPTAQTTKMPALSATALPTDGIVPTDLPAEVIQPTDLPAPTQPEYEAPVWPVGIDRQRTDTYLADDFSSNSYNWADVQKDTHFWGFEDGHYTFHLTEADYVIWAYLPVDFVPTTIGFDAAIELGFEEGGYGVMCHFQDEDNYHFVSIDPWNKEYAIGYLVNGEYEPLMRELWMPATQLKDSPYAVNSVMVTCALDSITLLINTELEAQVDLGSTATSGRTALFGETWEDVPEAGFKVLIDNFYAFIAQQ